MGTLDISTCLKIRLDISEMTGGVTFGLIGQECIDFLSSTVVGNDIEALVVHVENQVLALRERVSQTWIATTRKN